jgi:hypothetical protein
VRDGSPHTELGLYPYDTFDHVRVLPRWTATFETGPRVSPDRCARRPPTIDAMPLQIHTQPDPDHFCETCGGPSELVSQTITPWDGNETMAREVSPWTPRCADPGCQSRIPRHRR